MTHPSLLTRPLVHLLAAALLCPVAFAKTKPVLQEKQQTKKAAASASVRSVAKPLERKKAASTAKAKPVGKASPAPPGKPARQAEGDGPGSSSAKSAPAPQSPFIADPAELLAMVPASGPLRLDDVIRLAIASSPKLGNFRAEIAKARADKRSEQDWKNPELRLGYGSQDDNFLRHTYTDTTLKSDTSDFAALGPDGDLSTIGPYREIERIVTSHGKYEDSTVNEYFRSGNPDDPPDAARILESTSYERDSTTRSDGGDEQYSALLRFQLPNPGERKARIQRASAGIMLAEGEYLTEEDKLVREVRELFHDLSVMESTLGAQKKRYSSYTSLNLEMESAALADYAAMDAARARFEMTKITGDIRELETDINNIRIKIAQLCGLSSSSRINSGGFIPRRVIDLANLDHAYLVEVATLHRADMVESRSRLEIAKSHLAEAKAGKVPWITFFDIGYSQQQRGGYSGRENEWTARIAIEIPIWDISRINKRSKAYRDAATQWERQTELQRQRVAGDVSLAIERLRNSAAATRSYESDIRRQKRQMEDSVARVKAARADASDYVKGKRTEYERDDLTQQMEVGRYKAWSDYEKALMALEIALGVRIEEVLNGWRDK